MRGRTGIQRGVATMEERGMRMRLAICFALAIGLLAASAPRAFAHGEAADEPFLKDLTVAFFDVNISPTSVKVGEPVTITGSLKVLETWPYTLDPPQTAYLTPVVPGPVFVLTERTINGDPAFGSVFIEKGGIYNFKMVMLARNPGSWHVHPGIAIQGTGTLIGPGEWVTIQPSGQPFRLDVSLLNGKTVNLEHYGARFVWWWSFAGFLIGVVWMLYWTVPKRTVTRLAVTLQIPVNDDAPDIGLITHEDQIWMNVLAGLTVLMLVVGWIYMATKYPVRLPQQTDRFEPAFVSSGPDLAQVHATGASFDEKTDTLKINVDVKNIGTSPLTVKQYIMAMTTFVNGGAEDLAEAGPSHYVGQLNVDPPNPVAPGETAKLTLSMSSGVFEEERLIPLHDPQQLIAGLLRFENTDGKQEMVTTKSVLIPTEFRPQYLP
jgi:methane/ammonia monooxygenase subunit B